MSNLWAPGNITAAERVPGTIIQVEGFPLSQPLTNVVAFSTADSHGLALLEDGTLVGYGDNAFGQTSIPSDWTNIVSFATSPFYSVAARHDGTVSLIGRDSDTFLAPPPNATNVVQVSAGYGSCVALRRDGTVVAWGGMIPDPPSNLTNVVRIAAALDHAIALLSNGTVASWAQINQWGQANVPDGLSNVVDITASRYASFALHADGHVTSWGNTNYTIPQGLPPISKLVVGESYAVALLPSGRLMSWDFPLSFRGLRLLDYPTLATDLSLGIANFSRGNNAYAIVRDPYILAHPVDANLKEASDHDLSIDAYGTGGIHVQWAKDGIVLPGETNALLSLRDVRVSHAGNYHAVVSTDWVAVTSAVARVLVDLSVPYLVSNAPPVSVLAGQDVTLAPTIKGSLPISYQWYANSFIIPGATNPVLTLTNLSTADAGLYSLSASNRVIARGNPLRTPTIRVTVHVPPNIKPATADSHILFPGDSLALSPVISGEEPIQFQWLLNGLPLSGETSRQLILRNINGSAGGDYSLFVSNAYGTNTVRVTSVEISNSPPIIVRSPTPTSFQPGQPILLHVDARGTAPLTYSWFRESIHIANTTVPDFVITNSTTSDVGRYFVSVTNVLGKFISENALVSLGDPFPGQIDLPELGFRLFAPASVPSPQAMVVSSENDTRLLVGSESAAIYSVKKDAATPELWLDLTTKSRARGGNGVRSLALSPQFSEDRLIYVSYVAQATNELRISRFKAAPDFSQADPLSEELLLSIPVPFPNGYHAQLSFDSLGFLIVATGDGGFGSINLLDPLRHASNPQSLLGKILRISVKADQSGYRIPDDNPFSFPAQGRGEIWCLGLQRPVLIQNFQNPEVLLIDNGLLSLSELHHLSAGLPRQGHFGWSFRANGQSYNDPSPPDLGPWIEPQSTITNSIPIGALSGVGPLAGSWSRFSALHTLLSSGFAGMVFAKTTPSEVLVRSQFAPGRGRVLAADRTGRLFTEANGAYYELLDLGSALPPILRPPGGRYYNDVQVVLDSDTPDARIFHTLDGREPESFDTRATNGQTLLIQSSTTLKARSERPPLAPSITRTHSYELRVATPIFDPPTGPLIGSASVAITCETIGAEIRYTLDGSQPRPTSPLYEEPVTVYGNTRLMARAYKKGYVDSDLASMFYNGVLTAKPSATPNAGSVTNNTPVTLNCITPDAVIRYTLDGQRPDASSPIYTTPILIQGGQTLKAVAQSPGRLESDVLTVLYPLAIVAQPIVHPGSGPLPPRTPIVITCTNPAASIYYTLDGSIPSAASFLYQSPIEFTSPTLNLKAIALAQNWGDSPVIEATYVRWIPESTAVFTVAGTGSPGLVNGPLQSAQFRSPTGMCRDSNGNLYVADAENHVIRLIKTNGIVSTYAGTGQPGYRNSSALGSQFNYPVSVCIGPNGDLYVADSYNLRIRRITPTGTVSTLAGNGILDIQDGGGTSASFESMSQLTWGPGTNIYMTATDRLRIISTSGRVSTLLLQGLPFQSVLAQGALAFDSQDNATIATIAPVIVRCDMLGAAYIWVGDQDAFIDGPRLEARLLGFSGSSRGLAQDSSGTVYFSDLHRIRKLSPDGSVSTWAGTGEGGYINGLGSRSRFLRPAGILIHTNNSILVADSGNHCIRMIAPDADGDAIPDLFESSTSPFHLNSDDRLRDEDHDGIDNATEWGIGTDPAHADSTWRMAVDSTPNRLYVIIRWPSAQGRMYQLQYSGDLKTWLDSYEPFFGNGTVMEFTDPRPTSNLSKLYYRMRITNWDAGGTP